MDEPRLTIASWADEENPVAELAYGREDFGHVSLDGATGEAILTIYPRMAGSDWCLNPQQLADVLARAKDRLASELVASK